MEGVAPPLTHTDTHLRTHVHICTHAHTLAHTHTHTRTRAHMYSFSSLTSLSSTSLGRPGAGWGLGQDSNCGVHTRDGHVSSRLSRIW